MEHRKKYFKEEIKTPYEMIMIEGPVHAENLQTYHFHEQLIAFRQPSKQHQAIIEIARLPEGRIIVARENDTIIGYVTFLHPDPLERWSEANLDNLIELGAIEIIPKYRGLKVGQRMIQLALKDEFMENYILITTEYYWHWDLKGTGLSVWDYRKMMEKMMNAGGLLWFATDDPEICSHPANCLMVRIGKHVDQASIEKFDRIRFKNRFMY